ncbi:MAG TPA: ImmA/IrrE family metallo-endopeptidase [Flavisolibacter sp.]|nr:ImmA/IrrE family metallo-endopeptidase [Flavisolibacter sp.]
MNSAVNTQMIVLAREARGLNQNDLAEKINMSPTNLSKIERGDVSVSDELLESIADITSFPKHFFSQKGSVVPGNLSYRRRQTVAQRLLSPIHAQVNIIKRHVEFLTASLSIPTPSLPIMEVTEEQTPQDIAKMLRGKWRMGPGPVENLTKVVEENGIAVMQFDFGTPRVDTKSVLTDERLPIIFLNSEHTGDRLRFSLAYELGHLLMHTFQPIPLERDIAHEANLFAAELLMPAEDIKAEFDRSISIPLLGELKRKWKVSMISLLYRADDLGAITPNQKRYLLQQFNQLQIRRREPVELDVAAEEPRLIKQWLADFRSRTKLGIVEISALLCLHVDEFMELYF